MLHGECSLDNTPSCTFNRRASETTKCEKLQMCTHHKTHPDLRPTRKSHTLAGCVGNRTYTLNPLRSKARVYIFNLSSLSLMCPYRLCLFRLLYLYGCSFSPFLIRFSSFLLLSYHLVSSILCSLFCSCDLSALLISYLPFFSTLVFCLLVSVL